jgi:hypothetical protein
MHDDPADLLEFPEPVQERLLRQHLVQQWLAFTPSPHTCAPIRNLSMACGRKRRRGARLNSLVKYPSVGRPPMELARARVHNSVSAGEIENDREQPQ